MPTKRKDGRWQEQLTVTEGGRQKQKYFYGKTKQELLRKIAAYQETAARGPSFAEIADAWWESAEPELAYNTRKPYRPALARVKAHFGETPIREIRPADCSRFLAAAAKKYQMAEKTCRTQLMVLNQICRYAVTTGALELNPAVECSLPKGLKKYQRDLPTDENIARVKASTELEMGMVAFWIMYTGLRKGELLALTWDDVDIPARTITVRRGSYFENNKLKTKSTKSAAGVRVLPLLDRLAERLTPGKGLVIRGADGGPMSESAFRKGWDRYRRQSGVSCTPHQLRHAYATMLYEAGVEPKDMQRLLGHAQLSTTMDIYTHIRTAREAQVNQALLHIDLNV